MKFHTWCKHMFPFRTLSTPMMVGLLIFPHQAVVKMA